MKKTLLTLGLAAMATLGLSAAETSWSVEFKNAANNTQSDFTTSTTLDTFVESGASYLTGVTATEFSSYGQYGLKVGQNKKNGSITLGIAPASQVNPTKVEVQYSCNKDKSPQLEFKFNGIANANESMPKNDNYATATFTPSGVLTQLEFAKDNASTNNAEGFIYVHKVTVYYDDASGTPTVAAPQITMVEGDYGYTVEMTAAEGASIYYTDNGDEPTAASTLYTAPIEVWGNTTFKAIAKVGEDVSGVTTFTANPKYILTSIDDLMSIELEEGMEVPVVIKGNSTAIYKNGQRLFAKGGYAYALIFNNNATAIPDMNNGDVFSRVEGTYKIYNGLPEIADAVISADNITTGGTPVQPIIAEVETLGLNMLNYYVQVESANIESVSGKNATLKDNTGSIALYNQFGLENFENTENCKVAGFVSTYNNLQFLPISIAGGEEVVAAPEFNPESGTVPAFSKVELTAEEGAAIYWKYAAEDVYDEYDAEQGITLAGMPGNTVTINAYAEKNTVKSDVVTVTYTLGKADPSLRWLDKDGNEVDEVVVALDQNADELLPTVDGIIEAEPTLTSSNTAVAEIDTDIMGVKVVGVGETIITISVPESTTYAAGTASFKLVVVAEAQEDDIVATVDFLSDKNSSIAYNKNGSYKATWTSEDGKYVFNTVARLGEGTSNSNYPVLNTSDGLRIYASSNNIITVTAPENLLFSELVITTSDADVAHTPTIDGKAAVKVTEETPATRAATKQPGGDFSYKFDKPVGSFELSASGTSKNMPVAKIVMTMMTYQAAAVEGVDVEFDENAPVEYYNLQGVRVNNPGTGIYIRRQGTKVDKIYVK